MSRVRVSSNTTQVGTKKHVIHIKDSHIMYKYEAQDKIIFVINEKS